MLKLPSVPMLVAVPGFGSGQAMALLTQNIGLAQQNFSDEVRSGSRSEVA